jgi:hypothetical protein
MLLFKAREEVTIKAKPQLIFDIVGDISRHNELAGSGEVLRIRKITEGPVAVGTRFEADEDIRFRLGGMKLVSQSEIVSYDPPKSLSWTSSPPKMKPRRIQWWFRLTSIEGSTRVAHEVEVDMSPIMNILMALPYRLMRGGRLSRGMKKTLENLRQQAENKAA